MVVNSASFVVYDRSMVAIVGLSVAVASLVAAGWMLDTVGLRGATLINVFVMTCMAATFALMIG
jgi:hypothetical protein